MVAAAIVGAAVIGGGAAIAAGATQADAAESSAALQAQASREATGEQRRQYDLTRGDLAPWRETGETALQQYGALYGVGREGMLTPEEMAEARGGFQETPGYGFAFDEGVRALDRSASARGTLQGGGYGRELIRYGQGMANMEFGDYANRLASLAGVGQSATTATGQFGAQSASNIGNIMMTGAANQGNALMAAGTARASGYAGVANAASGAASNYLFLQAAQAGYFRPRT